MQEEPPHTGRDIKSAIAEFPLEAGQEDEDSMAKVTRLANITQDLRKEVEELQAKQVARTPPEELKEQRKVVFEDARKIKQRETSCAKELEDISMVWETLMEEVTVERIRVSRHTAEEKITVEKADMKKLAFQEKVAKMSKIKKL